MNKNYSFRKASENDYDFLYNLLKTTMKEHVINTWGEWDENFQQDYFKKKFDPSRTKIVQVSKIDAGSLMLTEDKEKIKVDRIFLLPEFQGKGIGSLIITDLIQKSKAENKKLSLTVIKSNLRAKKFYEKLGFRVISENKERYTLTI